MKKAAAAVQEVPEDINSNIMSSDSFSIMVEEKAVENNITCFEVLMDMIEKDALDPDNVPELLSERLRGKLEIEAKNLNLLKKDSKTIKSLL